ncbi:hypothetical protein SAMN03097699_0139 [Flavobacteriaceae bacterium MAR_2010_188]|nr:hypothetical protein SAMN03097699_0139 [Flavobacteriaceae bacterium MAR_2010_188]
MHREQKTPSLLREGGLDPEKGYRTEGFFLVIHMIMRKTTSSPISFEN